MEDEYPVLVSFVGPPTVFGYPLEDVKLGIIDPTTTPFSSTAHPINPSFMSTFSEIDTLLPLAGVPFDEELFTTPITLAAVSAAIVGFAAAAR